MQVTALTKHFLDALVKVCTQDLQHLEVIKTVSGIAYIPCLNWKEFPFFCP